MKLNRLLAAGLLAASAVPAMASIQSPGSGNGELFLVVWDGTDQVSYTRDLGIFMDDFLAISGSSLPTILLDDAFFAGFLGVADNSGASDFSDLKFAVIAGDTTAGLGSRRIFTTVDNLVTPYNNGNLNSGSAYVGLYSNNQVVVSSNTSHEGPVSVNGTSFDTSPNGAYFLTQNGPTFQNSIVGGTWTNSNFINTESVFRSFSGVGTAGGVQTARTDFAGLWNVTNTGGVWQATYTVTPIPEADGIAMMLAGFGALGFVVRRRRQPR